MDQLLCEVERIAGLLVADGHKRSPASLRQLVELARQQHQAICNQRQEMIDMARTNQQNLQVVLGALTDAKNKAVTDDQKAALDGLKTAAQDITPDPEPAAAEAGK